MTIRTGLVITGAWITTCVVAFAFGRHSLEPEVRVETVIEEKIVEVVKTVVAEQKERVKYVHREIYITPDGGTKIVEDSKTETKSETTVVSEANTTNVREEARVSNSESSGGDWRVGVTLGANLGRLRTLGPLAPWSGGGLVYGLSAERRILGPVWAGVWAQDVGAAGLSLGVEF